MFFSKNFFQIFALCAAPSTQASSTSCFVSCHRYVHLDQRLLPHRWTVPRPSRFWDISLQADLQCKCNQPSQGYHPSLVTGVQQFLAGTSARLDYTLLNLRLWFLRSALEARNGVHTAAGRSGPWSLFVAHQTRGKTIQSLRWCRRNQLVRNHLSPNSCQALYRPQVWRKHRQSLLSCLMFRLFQLLYLKSMSISHSVNVGGFWKDEKTVKCEIAA